MSTPEPTCPMSRSDLVERYFMEHRAKLVDIAAFLDRVDRAAMPGQPGEPGDPEDFRLAAFRRAIAILQEGSPQRARRVLEFLSDPTDEPIPSAAGLKGAFGAYPGQPAPEPPGPRA